MNLNFTAHNEFEAPLLFLIEFWLFETIFIDLLFRETSKNGSTYKGEWCIVKNATAIDVKICKKLYNYIFSRKVHEETLETVSQMNSAVSLDIIKSGPYAGAKAIPQILGGNLG